jgi:AcrR family transcriptional regulator
MKDQGVRSYRMSARADTTAETGERILDAVSDMFWEQPSDRISLDEVSRRSGVSVRTVIRRFGGKEGLFAAAAARELGRTRSERDLAPVGDTAAAVTVLVDHYESMGDRVLKLLAEEERLSTLTEVVERGRELHRAWCARVFAPALKGRHGVDRDRRMAQLVALCDVYTWKLLRRDAGLSRRQTELALVELLKPMTEDL